MDKGGEGGCERGSGLLRKVLFPLMDERYLADVSSEPGVEDVGLEGMLLEAGMLEGEPRGAWGRRRLRYLDARVLVPRGRMGGVRGRLRAAAGGV